MNPTTLPDLAAAQRALQAAQGDVNRAARRVFDAATSLRDSRPDEETWLVEEVFGEWNRERDNIFWAETDFHSAEVRGDKVRLVTGYHLRCETNSFALHFPVEWLALSQEALVSTLTVEWQKLLGQAQVAKAKEDQKQRWADYRSYLLLKEEFEGKPAPEEPKP